MSRSAQQHVHDEEATYRAVARARPRTGPGLALKIAILLFAVAAGLVYYASQLWLQHQSTSDALVSANGELARVQRKSSERGGKLVALAQRDQEREELLKQATAKALELNTALAAAQTRLDELNQERSVIKEQ